MYCCLIFTLVIKWLLKTDLHTLVVYENLMIAKSLTTTKINRINQIVIRLCDYVEENIPSVEGKSGEDEEGWFILEFVVLTNKFKEIKQVRKYSVQSLVGNLGGYIGLCLGYALMSLPSIILEIWRNMKDICLSK